MNSAPKDVAAKLVTELAYTIGTDLFVHVQPDDVPECVTVKSGPGLAESRYQNVFAEPTQKNGIQIIVRKLDPEEGESECRLIQKTLREWNNVKITSGDSQVQIGGFIPQGDILPLGRQPNARWFEWSMNFIGIREKIIGD